MVRSYSYVSDGGLPCCVSSCLQLNAGVSSGCFAYLNLVGKHEEIILSMIGTFTSFTCMYVRLCLMAVMFKSMRFSLKDQYEGMILSNCVC